MPAFVGGARLTPATFRLWLLSYPPIVHPTEELNLLLIMKYLHYPMFLGTVPVVGLIASLRFICLCRNLDLSIRTSCRMPSFSGNCRRIPLRCGSCPPSRYACSNDHKFRNACIDIYILFVFPVLAWLYSLTMNLKAIQAAKTIKVTEPIVILNLCHQVSSFSTSTISRITCW